MCASGTTAIDEELCAILQTHQQMQPANATTLGLQTTTATAAAVAAASSSLNRQPFSSRSSSELPTTVGMFSAMFGSHPSDQRLALPTSSVGLVASSNNVTRQHHHPPHHHHRFSQQSSAMPDEVASQMQARQFYLQANERSSNNSSEEAMEMDEGSRQRQQDHHSSGSPMMLGGEGKNLLRESMQVPTVLMRYHSAPSSMLASLAEVGDEFFSQQGSSPLSQGADSEFARFFPDDLATQRVHQADKPRALNGLEPEHRRGDLSDRSRLISRFKRAAANGGIAEDVTRVPLSAILEHGPEVPPGNYGSSQISLSGRQQGARTGLTVGVGSLVSESGNCNPLITSAPVFSAVPQTKSNLIRHSSSPAGILSRLATEVQGENSGERPNPCFSGPSMHPPAECLPERASAARAPGLVCAFPVRNCTLGPGRGLPAENSDDLVTSNGRLGVSSPNKSGLLRHSSSPAGLLSQLNLDGLADAGEKLMMPSSSGNSSEEGSFDRRGGPAFLPNYPWDEAVAASGSVMAGSPNGTSFAARKRVRELDEKYFASSTLSDSQEIDALDHGASLANQFMPTATSPENLYSDKLSTDTVPCRSRAKRGCATHPRSIAERVRRTKISERMRKLQELVPNMDKQTNTADMLDEAVEYVKFLQRQVQELTENRPKCDGSCKQKATSSQ